MKRDGRQFGIAAALATPFAADGSIDADRVAAQSLRLLERGCSAVCVFGTTGEGPSIGLAERRPVLDLLRSRGFPSDRLLCGIVSSAVGDALDHAGLAAEHGCRRLLVAPPYYYKGVADADVRAWFVAFLGGLPAGSEVILYNIPQLTGVPVPAGMVRFLKERFPAVVTGVKDSAGDWDNSAELLAAFPDLDILIGDERLLARGVALGAAGSISGVANFRPETLTAIMAGRPAEPGLAPLVDTIVALPVTPAVKALIAHDTGDAGWLAARPPLAALDAAARAGLTAAHDRLFAATEARPALAAAR